MRKSKRNIRKIKAQISAEEKAILERDKEWFENFKKEHFPTEAKSEKSTKKKNWIWAIPAACVLIMAFSVIGYYLLKNDKPHYTSVYEVKSSEIEYLNNNLKHTRVSDNCNYVFLTYEVHTEKPAYFSASFDEESETYYKSCTLNVVIDREYPYLGFSFFAEQIIYLDYAVDLNINSSVETGDEGDVYTFEIYARLDTGDEKYFFNYFELSLDSEPKFEGWLESVIFLK